MRERLYMCFRLPPSRGKVDRAAGARRMRGLLQRVSSCSYHAEPPPHPALRATFPREGGRENAL